MTPDDLFSEFANAARQTDARHFLWLKTAHGVDEGWLYGGPSRFGVTRISTSPDGFFEPCEAGGMNALILPALPLPDDLDPDYPEHDIGDLIACDPRQPSRVWVRCGYFSLLNPVGVDWARHYGEPLRVFSDPIAWLSGNGRGVAVLDWGRNLNFALSGPKRIICDDITTAERLDRHFREPKGPEIHITETRGAA